MRNSTPICHHCHRPIREGNARWGGRDPEQAWHYACATTVGLTLAANRSASLASALAVLSPAISIIAARV